MNEKVRNDLKKHIYNIIEIGNKSDALSRAFDIFIAVVIFVNLFITLFSTFDESAAYDGILDSVEFVTILIFTVEYALRIWTADMLYPKKTWSRAVFAFVFSFYGIIDLLTFLPYYLPIMFPAGVVAFRMFRVIRIFRLFRINSQSDAFNVITGVLYEKRNQLMSSIVLILIFMIASSLAMYSLEHDAQPEAFSNAFSGIWWSVSTLLTVGYGDIYPITVAGKIMAIVISFLGVGMVAIPTGIISAGFVEHYSKMRSYLYHGVEHELQFVTSEISEHHAWVGKTLSEIVFPPGLIAVIVHRGEKTLIPKGSTRLQTGDKLIIGAKNYRDEDVELKEISVEEGNEWVGMHIRELALSEEELIVMIMRGSRSLIPSGNTEIYAGDRIMMYLNRS